MEPTVWTIGHHYPSKFPLEIMHQCLLDNRMEYVIDVRPLPHRIRQEYLQWPMQQALEKLGIRYAFFGGYYSKTPTRERYEDIWMTSDHDSPRLSIDFRKGISVKYVLTEKQQAGVLAAAKRIADGARNYRICIMGEDRNPHKDFRGKVIVPELARMGVRVIHLVPDITEYMAFKALRGE